MDLNLDGAACVVTGASRGIGRAVAVGLAGERSNVLLVARDAEALAQTAGACCAAGGQAESVSADLSAPGVADRLWDECAQRFGAPEVLVHCAGSSGRGALGELSDADWQAQLDMHVLVPMRLLRRFAPAMASAGRGRIVMLSSASGKRPQLDSPAYSVAKAAELSLTRVYAEAYAADGVRINAVAPGPVDTGMWTADGGIADREAQRRGTTRQSVIDEVAAAIPTGKFATPEQVAVIVCMLCSPHADAVTGAAWSVDGGAVRSIT